MARFARLGPCTSFALLAPSFDIGVLARPVEVAVDYRYGVVDPLMTTGSRLMDLFEQLPSKCFFLISMKLTCWPIFLRNVSLDGSGVGEIPQQYLCL